MLDIKTKFDKGEFNDEMFETNKKAVLTCLKEKDKNLNEQCSRFWEEITIHEYNFNR